MRYKFSKMHGLGNDFVVFDATKTAVDLTETQLRLLGDRHFGVGCDQILMVEPPQNDRTDFFYRMYNADGSEANQCGNGARCFARFLIDQGLSDKSIINVGTNSGDIQVQLLENGDVKINMGAPRLRPSDLPFIASEQADLYHLDVAGVDVQINAVSMGNPHAVLLVDDVTTAGVATLGPQIESHSHFPERVNVGFMAIESRQSINLRVYERGAGETLACGTGACAAVVAGRLRNLLDEQVLVHLPGGDLVISWDKDDEPVWMTGPATLVFEGAIEL